MLHLIAIFVLAVAIAGTITSTIVFFLAVAGSIKFRRNARREQEVNQARAAQLPPVSVLKPVHGLEARMRENIESFFRQDYPTFEILFAADEADDSALPLIRELCAKYPHIPTRIFVTGKPPWPNAQNYCYHCMTPEAKYDVLVTSDSDVEVAPNYLRDVVSPLLDPKVGAVTCMFRGKNAGGFWAALDAIGQSVEFSAGVLIVNLMEEMKFGLGPTVVVRRDSLAKMGGFEAAREYLSNDFVYGNFIQKAGYRVVLSGHVVDHISPPMTFAKMWERQLRWAMGTRYSRPKGHLGSVLTFAAPFGMLGLIAGLALGYTKLGLALFATAMLTRMAECWIVGWWAAGDPVALRWVLFYPLRELHGFIIWCASYLSRRSLWRDTRYELLEGGRLVARRADGSVVMPR
jgi:ceramide glucosyltransferase